MTQVPDDHRAGAASARADLAFEFEVIERMVLDLDREPLLGRIGRRAFRDGPGLQDAVDLEPEVIVQRGRVVLLDDEPVGTLRRFRSRHASYRGVERAGTFVTVASPTIVNGERDETAAERLDRNTIELLNELRVAGTGIQVMFGFLLIVPFNTGWRHVSSFGHTVYFVTLLCVAVSGVLLIAPSVHHRILFRHGEKRYLITIANRVAILGDGVPRGRVHRDPGSDLRRRERTAIGTVLVGAVDSRRDRRALVRVADRPTALTTRDEPDRAGEITSERRRRHAAAGSLRVKAIELESR